MPTRPLKRERPLDRAGGFAKGLKAALEALARLDAARVGIVAATAARADYIRDLCTRTAPDPKIRLETYLDSQAAQILDSQVHHLVILDATVEELARQALKVLARQRLPSCKVIEIKKWSVEPPK